MTFSLSAVVISLLSAGIAALGWRAIRDTTLSGPFAWALFSFTCLTLAPIASLLTDTPTAGAALELAAAGTTLLPLMSLLGAKRPQDRGWHFVVLTLWVILLLPALETLVLRPGQLPSLSGIRAVFLIGLLLLGFLNHAATRFWGSATLAVLGQACLLVPHVFPLTPFGEFIGDGPPLLGRGFLFAALVMASISARQRPSGASDWDRQWLDFRDQFGLLWSLRVAERLNAAARTAEWPLELRWSGFRDLQGNAVQTLPSPDVATKLDQAIHNLLRRFVSPRWIARRTTIAVD